MKKILIIIFLFNLIPAFLFAAATVTVGPGETYETINAGLAALDSGGVMTIKDGTYTDSITTIPNGSDGDYTIIKAENDGGVIVSTALAMIDTSEYIQIEGISFVSTNQKGILGNHLKFFRCAFVGGPENGNNVNTSIGIDAAYILLEDCWFYGSGGRYTLLVFRANHIVLRRVLIRNDGGWDDSEKESEPSAGLTIYNSTYVEVQNLIVIDTNPTASDNWSGSVYTVYNTSVTGSTSNVNYTGMILINSPAAGGLNLDGAGTSTSMTISNSVIIDNRSGVGTGSAGNHSIVASNLLIKDTPGGASNFGVGDWGAGSPTIIDSIITGIAGADITGWSASYVDKYDNDSAGSCSNCQTYDPEANGLLYPTKITDFSSLDTDGNGGGRIGPEILEKIGSPGTLHGESGYADVQTGESLWPFPNEDRIKTDMATVSTRGFCAATANVRTDTGYITLTSYIWEYLGNTGATAGLYEVTTGGSATFGNATINSIIWE